VCVCVCVCVCVQPPMSKLSNPYYPDDFVISAAKIFQNGKQIKTKGLFLQPGRRFSKDQLLCVFLAVKIHRSEYNADFPQDKTGRTLMDPEDTTMMFVVDLGCYAGFINTCNPGCSYSQGSTDEYGNPLVQSVYYKFDRGQWKVFASRDLDVPEGAEGLELLGDYSVEQ
jgi:hypothetical protein